VAFVLAVFLQLDPDCYLNSLYLDTVLLVAVWSLAVFQVCLSVLIPSPPTCHLSVS